MKISIIIVTWNGLDYLKSFLPSVVDSDYDDFEIILADNASSDDSILWVTTQYPQVKIVALDRNYGYCGGNNKAVPYASGELLIFLNNDVRVETGWLRPISIAFVNNPKLGAAQPKIRSERDPSLFEYAGAAGGLLDRYGYPYCQGRIFDHCEVDSGQYDHMKNIFWASGAALTIRKDLFEGIGGFDEDFHLHMEEIDLCWNLIRRGFTIELVPDSVVFHVGGGSLNQNSPHKLGYNIRNSLSMLWKHLPTYRLLPVLSTRCLFDTIAALRECSKGRFKHGWAIWKAHLQFILLIPINQKKRRTLRQANLEFSDAWLSRFLLPWQYFIRRKATSLELRKPDRLL